MIVGYSCSICSQFYPGGPLHVCLFGNVREGSPVIRKPDPVVIPVRRPPTFGQGLAIGMALGAIVAVVVLHLVCVYGG